MAFIPVFGFPLNYCSFSWLLVPPLRLLLLSVRTPADIDVHAVVLVCSYIAVDFRAGDDMKDIDPFQLLPEPFQVVLRPLRSELDHSRPRFLPLNVSVKNHARIAVAFTIGRYLPSSAYLWSNCPQVIIDPFHKKLFSKVSFRKESLYEAFPTNRVLLSYGQKNNLRFVTNSLPNRFVCVFLTVG